MNCLKKIRHLVSPYFVVRYYILRDIMRLNQKYDFNGTVLDIGCGSKPYKEVFNKIKSYQGIDFKKFSINSNFNEEAPDYYFDRDYLKTSALSFDDNSYNNTFSFQVLEHCVDYQKTLLEMIRIAKKDGYVLISFPFIGGLHEQPNDFQRITHYKIKDIVERNGDELVEIIKQGSLFSSISILINEYIFDLASRNKLLYFIVMLIYLPLLIFEYIALLLDKVFVTRNIFINYLILIKKK